MITKPNRSWGVDRVTCDVTGIFPCFLPVPPHTIIRYKSVRVISTEKCAITTPSIHCVIMAECWSTIPAGDGRTAGRISFESGKPQEEENGLMNSRDVSHITRRARGQQQTTVYSDSVTARSTDDRTWNQTEKLFLFVPANSEAAEAGCSARSRWAFEGGHIPTAEYIQLVTKRRADESLAHNNRETRGQHQKIRKSRKQDWQRYELHVNLMVQSCPHVKFFQVPHRLSIFLSPSQEKPPRFFCLS